MFSNKSNRNLGIILLVLVVIVVIIFVTDGKNERSFRENLVDIDTTQVSEITISSIAHGDVRLFKNNDGWMVDLDENNSVSVPDNKIKNLLNQLLDIKPKRLAARSQSKWKDFQVDSSGTRVVVKEGGSKALDIIIGRFAFQQPRTMNTYVRLQNDVDVYEVNGFLQSTFNQEPDNFRDGRVLGKQGKYDNWKNIEFNYPDSSFQLVKVNDKWRTIKYQVDSAKTAQYLRRISDLSTNKFIKDISPESLTSPIYSMNIQKEEGDPIQINAYNKDNKIVITSTANTEAVFNGSENNFWKKLFIGEKSLLPKN